MTCVTDFGGTSLCRTESLIESILDLSELKKWTFPLKRECLESTTGFLGSLFPTPLYHGSAELAERPASMQAGFRRNDEEARIKATRLPVCVYRFVVIPAKAGIQEGDDGVPQETLIESEFPKSLRAGSWLWD